MTELEILKHAKMYIDKMANGIDPLSDSPVPDNDCINQIRISRCLFYVSDVLRKVIENDGNIESPHKTKKANFAITEEELKHYIIEEKPIPISEIANKINALVDLNTMNKFKYSCITSFLLEGGFLEEKENADGKKFKVPTEYGNSIGISREERQGQYGTYYITVYNAEAQQIILDNIFAIIELNNSQKKSAEFQGQPWTENYDEALIDLYNKNVPISEIAITLKRTNSAIRARLRNKGLIK